MKRSSPVRAPYLVVVLLLSCSGKALDVGSDEHAANVAQAGSVRSCSFTPPPRPALTPWAEAASSEANASAPIDGTWTGYVQGEPVYGPDNASFTLAFTGMKGDEIYGTLT